MAGNTSKYALRVGILVAFGCLLLVVLIFFVGRQQNLFSATTSIKTKFNNVSGLQVGNNVRFNGITIGTVSDILLVNDTSVVVQLMIEKDKLPFIRTNSRTTIGTEGLMGDKVVTISSGSEEFPQVKENDYIASLPPIEMDAIMNNLQSTAENAEIISSELAMILFKVNNGNGVLSRMLADTTMAENFAQTMENLENSSKSLEENLSAAKQSFILRGAYRKMKKDEEAAEKKAAEEKEKAGEEKEKTKKNR